MTTMHSMPQSKARERLRAVWIHKDNHARLARLAKATRYSMRELAERALDAQQHFMARDDFGFSRADVKELTEAK